MGTACAEGVGQSAEDGWQAVNLVGASKKFWELYTLGMSLRRGGALAGGFRRWCLHALPVPVLTSSGAVGHQTGLIPEIAVGTSAGSGYLPFFLWNI